MRFTYAMDFIENDYDKYKLIENATTEKDKIKILKNIIIKDFKLTKEDFKIILENYLVTEGNLINNYQEPIDDTKCSNICPCFSRDCGSCVDFYD
jgi:predicted nuclease of restriction endonuclease-like RecB superfamily